MPDIVVIAVRKKNKTKQNTNSSPKDKSMSNRRELIGDILIDSVVASWLLQSRSSQMYLLAGFLPFKKLLMPVVAYCYSIFLI